MELGAPSNLRARGGGAWGVLPRTRRSLLGLVQLRFPWRCHFCTFRLSRTHPFLLQNLVSPYIKRLACVHILDCKTKCLSSPLTHSP